MHALLRSIYDGIPGVREAVTWVRVQRKVPLAKAHRPPFNGDTCFTEAMDRILELAGATHFVETGTYLGDTTRHLAERHPKLSIMSVEAHPVYLGASRAVLKAYGNVRQIHGNSADVVEQLLASGEAPERTVFFLDAHWHDYLPLPREIELIGRERREAVFAIHDFHVPGHDHFRFDSYKGKPIDLAMLTGSICADRKYHVILPKYGPEAVYGSDAPERPALRGHAIVFQGMEEVLHSLMAGPSGAHYDLRTIQRD